MDRLRQHHPACEPGCRRFDSFRARHIEQMLTEFSVSLFYCRVTTELPAQPPLDSGGCHNNRWAKPFTKKGRVSIDTDGMAALEVIEEGLLLCASSESCAS